MKLIRIERKNILSKTTDKPERNRNIQLRTEDIEVAGITIMLLKALTTHDKNQRSILKRETLI